MTIVPSTTCSHCHALNPATRRYCHQCGHEAQQPRLACACPQCRTRPVGTVVVPPKGMQP